MTRTVEDTITELFEDVTFEQLIVWADLLKVEHKEEYWMDDAWPDKESALRREVSDVAIKVFEKGSK